MGSPFDLLQLRTSAAEAFKIPLPRPRIEQIGPGGGRMNGSGTVIVGPVSRAGGTSAS